MRSPSTRASSACHAWSGWWPEYFAWPTRLPVGNGLSGGAMLSSMQSVPGRVGSGLVRRKMPLFCVAVCLEFELQDVVIELGCSAEQPNIALINRDRPLIDMPIRLACLFPPKRAIRPSNSAIHPSAASSFVTCHGRSSAATRACKTATRARASMTPIGRPWAAW